MISASPRLSLSRNCPYREELESSCQGAPALREERQRRVSSQPTKPVPHTPRSSEKANRHPRARSGDTESLGKRKAPLLARLRLCSQASLRSLFLDRTGTQNLRLLWIDQAQDSRLDPKKRAPSLDNRTDLSGKIVHHMRAPYRSAFPRDLPKGRLEALPPFRAKAAATG